MTATADNNNNIDNNNNARIYIYIYIYIYVQVSSEYDAENLPFSLATSAGRYNHGSKKTIPENDDNVDSKLRILTLQWTPQASCQN